MDDNTSLSLLNRVSAASDPEAWDRLVALYRPLLLRWLRSCDVQAADAEDLVQEVLTVVVQEVRGFDHNQQVGAFRTWLRRILVNRVRNFWRSRQQQAPGKGTSSMLEELQQLEDDASALSRVWNAEHDQQVMAHLLETVRPRFEPQTWEAFRRQVLEGHRPDQVARELGLSLSSVYAARSRVLKTLRQEAGGLVDVL